MNIKLTTFSLIVAATCGLAFNTAAQAGEEGEGPQAGGMRFHFEANKYRMDHVESHHYNSPSTPSRVASGAAPKSLLGLDPGFMTKATPLPVAAPAPVAQPQTSIRLANNSPFASVLRNPQPNPMMASPAQAMNFGKPNAPATPQIAQALPQPQHHVTTNGYPKLLRVHRPAPQVATAAPAIATYGNKAAFDTGSKLPGYSNNSGSGANTSLVGTVLRHK